MANLSITTSNDSSDLQVVWKRFWSRLGLFLAPFIVGGSIAAPLLLWTGEFLPANTVAQMQIEEPPFLYLPRFTDHTFALKLEATRLRHPDIVAIGSSRSNQWRSAMFHPLDFYNAGGPFYAVSDFVAALEAWKQNPPRVMILTLDYFMFIDAFQAISAASSKNSKLSKKEIALALKGLVTLAFREPSIFIPYQKEPIYGLPAFGTQAIETGTGFRIDGSFQYGHVMLDYSRPGTEQAVESITNGGGWPLQAGDKMLPSLMREFERFAALAREQNIALVAVTPPFDPPVLEALRNSPYHEAFRQFHSPQTVGWLQGLGINYHDFSDIGSIDGRTEEFVDPYHPSEPAYVRMLLKLMDDHTVSTLLPDLNLSRLRTELDRATWLEVYRNVFPESATTTTQ